MITVFIINDHPLIRAALRALVDAQPGLAVIGVAGGDLEALERLGCCGPDVVLLGPMGAAVDRIDLGREIQRRHHGMGCVTLRSNRDWRPGGGADRPGPTALDLPDTVEPTTLFDALRRAGGESERTAAVVGDAAGPDLDDHDHHGLDRLTAKERTIFDLIGEGLTNRQIAERVGLAEKSVKNRVSSLFRKLRLSRRAEVAALAGRLHERESHLRSLLSSEAGADKPSSRMTNI